MSDKLSEPEQLFSTAIEVFCQRLEEDGVDSVSLELVRDRWIPELLTLEQRVEGLEEALEKIIQWSEAYPLDIFPEPDFKKAQQLLKAGGMTLDAISASNMRHVIERVGGMAKAALAAEEEA